MFDNKDKIKQSFSKSFWKPLSFKQQVVSTIQQVEKLVLASNLKYQLFQLVDLKNNWIKISQLWRKHFFQNR